MNFIKLTHDKLELNTINDLVADENCGATSFFLGQTRNSFEGQRVISLEYEAYEPMAQKVMQQLCDEIREKWQDVKHIAIHHRLGNVPVKEASVVIAVGSPHRKTSLEAVTFGIEELKKRVPIWKKELYDKEGLDSAWKENKECTWGSEKK